ncbi:MAG: prolipoprotein diacylglyceryl transferase [Oligoflexia bacterium]|nr:prolipoprotein diacylglyceryl transferase [Oligoflexia bacterium]
MHPLLFEIGPVPVHTYGVLVALGFLGGLLLNRHLASRSGIDPDRMVDLSFWGMLVGFLGARVLFMITRIGDFLADPLAIFRVWEGGLVFWGGPIAVFFFCLWYLRRHRLPFWKIADIGVCGLVVGHILGRFGCLGAGCCYGKATGTDFGIRLHNELVDRALRGVPLHPVQLYEAFALAILLVGLLWVFRRKRVDGQVFLTYAIAYPVLRSVIEEFRGDSIRGFVIEGMLSTSQFVSALVFVAALATLVYRSRRAAAGKAIA